jgi:hypothetical protein
LLVNTAVVLVAFVNDSQVTAFPVDKARYLISLYLSAPLIFGVLWSTLRPALEQGARFLGLGNNRIQVSQPDSIPDTWPPLARSQNTLAFAAAVMLTLLLSLSIFSGASTFTGSADAASYNVPEPAWIAQTLAVFDEHGVRTFYSDSYWDCYNLAFESNERQVCAVLGTDGQIGPVPWPNRYGPYVESVAHDPHPAYFLPASQAEEVKFAQSDLPKKGYSRTVVDGYAIYYYGGTA